MPSPRKEKTEVLPAESDLHAKHPRADPAVALVTQVRDSQNASHSALFSTVQLTTSARGQFGDFLILECASRNKEKKQ